jgi:hypothetical protein
LPGSGGCQPWLGAMQGFEDIHNLIYKAAQCNL